jgi:muramoyltetrapeptide carboxypeptidase
MKQWGIAGFSSALTMTSAQVHATVNALMTHYSVGIEWHETAPNQRFSATDAQRLALLHELAQQPEYAVIVAARGGYGLSRLMHQIDFSYFQQSSAHDSSSQIWVGHSDVTVLHLAILAQLGVSNPQRVRLLAGPMLQPDWVLDESAQLSLNSVMHTHFIGALAYFTEKTPYRIQCFAHDDINPPFQCHSLPKPLTGVCWGGNLSMLMSVVGTPFMPQIERGLLFIEDVNEHPYRLERMLIQLRDSGILAQQQALIIGDCSGYRLAPHDAGYDFSAMLTFVRDELCAPLGVALVTGLPFGHIAGKVSIPVGELATLSDLGSGHYELAFHPENPENRNTAEHGDASCR